MRHFARGASVSHASFPVEIGDPIPVRLGSPTIAGVTPPGGDEPAGAARWIAVE